LKKPNDRPRRAGEQRLSFVRGRVAAATFEELARDAEGKVAFEIGSAGPQHAAFLPLRDRAGDLEQRGLADAGTGFDQHDPATAHKRFDRRQFGVAFEEVGHSING
jgi:hypothetical protein